MKYILLGGSFFGGGRARSTRRADFSLCGCFLLVILTTSSWLFNSFSSESGCRISWSWIADKWSLDGEEETRCGGDIVSTLPSYSRKNCEKRSQWSRMRIMAKAYNVFTFKIAEWTELGSIVMCGKENREQKWWSCMFVNWFFTDWWSESEISTVIRNSFTNNGLPGCNNSWTLFLFDQICCLGLSIGKSRSSFSIIGSVCSLNPFITRRYA